MQALFLAVAVVWLAAGIAVGQTGTSGATGVVTDQSGAVVAGASVTLSNELTGVAYKTVSSDAGTYLFDAIPPGTYTVLVELQGFKTFKSKNNVVNVGVSLTVNAKLEVGEATTVVEVTESFERVQTTTSGNFGTVVDNRTLTSLPLGLDVSTGGRNPLVFVRLQPGVNFGANTGGSSHVNGARDRAFNYTLDGIDINETSAGGSEFSPLRTNPDSLQEFRVVTSNATAQYGRNSGAQVELTTKSGTNKIHGSLFYFHRNNGFSANEWEANFNNQIRPRLIQHQWGLSVGGPIFKNRTFYFFNYQQQRQIRPFTITRTVYTQAARQGLFRYASGTGLRNIPAGQTGAVIDLNGNPLLPTCDGTVTTNCINSFNIGARDPRLFAAPALPGGLDPAILNEWIGLTSLPNDFTVGDGLNTAGFRFSGGRLDPQRDFVVRIDHTFDQNNNIYGRFAWGKQDTVNDTGNAGAPRFPGLSPIVNTIREPNNLAIGYRRVISPTMVNELVFGTNHFLFNFITPTAGEVLPFFLNNVTDPLLVSRGNLRKLTTYQLVDNWSWNRGAHVFRGGINFRYQQHIDSRGAVGSVNSEMEVLFSNTTFSDLCATGTFATGGSPGVVSGAERFCLPGTSGTLAISSSDIGRLRSTINDLLGRISRIQQGFVAADDFQSYLPGGTLLKNDARYGEYDFYFQDNWKLWTNFTVDLGLRLELKGHPTNPRNRIFIPNQPLVAGAPQTDTLKWVKGPLYDNDYNNWSPSIGFAWDPFKTGKTSIRANYRLAYDRINTFVISSSIFNNLPGVTNSVQNTNFGVNGGPGGTAGRWRDPKPVIAPAAGTTPESQTQPAAFSSAGSITVFDPEFRAPKTNMWQLDIQREIWKGIVVDVAYIGRRATGLFGAYDANQVDYRNNGFLPEFIALKAASPCGGTGQPSCPTLPLLSQLYGPAGGTNFIGRTFLSTLLNGSVAGLAQDAATRTVANTASPFCPATGTCSLLRAANLSRFFFKPFPQFNGSVNVIESNDFSTYHALQVVVIRKFTSGVQFQGSYTWSKSLDTRSFDPAFTVVSRGGGQSASSSPFDILNRRLNYARSDFDRTHIFTGYAIWDLPIGPGKRIGSTTSGVLARTIEGWTLASNWILQAGRPFTVYSGFSQFSSTVNSTANCNNCPRNLGTVRLLDVTFADTAHPGGVPSYFEASERALFSQPGPGEIGNTGRNFFTGPGTFNLDAALLKTTRLTERYRVELRLEAFNLTNSPSFGFPTTTIPSLSLSGGVIVQSASTFGRIRDNVNSSSRKLRIGVKLHF